MMAKSIMVQGTGSGVGKSVIVAALCRIFKQDGKTVAPFKSQNMALNSYPTAEGGEMGRAQVVQAWSAGIEPAIEMNPILIKPSSDCQAQLIVQGKPFSNCTPKTYYEKKKWLRKIVRDSYQRLAEKYEVVVIEGAGSPAEINLRTNDLVNMYVARFTSSPVILVADIDLGGVFAWIYGTIKLLTPSERKLVKGVIINKFRGDIDLLTPGIKMLEKKIKIPILGVVPYYYDIKIEEEDSVRLPKYQKQAEPDMLDIVVIYLPHVSNFTDFDVFEAEPGVNLRYVKSAERIGEPDVLIIPGSKSVISDLRVLREHGFEEKILALAAKNTVIVGVCGGYQMLGETITDPLSLESGQKEITGLGLLKIKSALAKDKTVTRTGGTVLSGFAKRRKVRGYEIHHGVTETNDEKALFKLTDGRFDGAINCDGKIWGTYLHGVFDEDGFRHAFLKQVAEISGKSSSFKRINKNEFRERQFDKLARHVRENVDLKKIYEILEGA